MVCARALLPEVKTSASSNNVFVVRLMLRSSSFKHEPRRPAGATVKAHSQNYAPGTFHAQIGSLDGRCLGRAEIGRHQRSLLDTGAGPFEPVGSRVRA